MGGELTSLVCNDREYIWQRDPKFWKGACPLMFPICGGLKDGVCYIDGKEYSIEKHGYARFKTFEVENKTGGLLPETGGIGTTIFYVVGGLLMVAAFVLLVSKKRMASFA